MNGIKQQWPRAVGLEVAREVCQSLAPVCERLIVAGSLRRRKSEVGDVEIVYIGKEVREHDPEDMFAERSVNLADEVIGRLEAVGVLERRPNKNGNTSYGKWNKLMRHVRTGMPVDLFQAEEDRWWNYLVCRTGPAESNMAVASRAKAMGYRWTPYGKGFVELASGEVKAVESEREVFAFVGMEYREPWER
jgi:DNA polymerase/3'-5' exonuclease PolX